MVTRSDGETPEERLAIALGRESAPGKPIKGKRVQFEPTEDQRRQVEILRGLGLKRSEIAMVTINPKTKCGIRVETLSRHFRAELEQGKIKAKMRLLASLTKKAVSATHKHSTQAAMFLLRCQHGFVPADSASQDLDDTSTGVLVAPAAQTPSKWIQRQTRKNEQLKTQDDVLREFEEEPSLADEYDALFS